MGAAPLGIAENPGCHFNDFLSFSRAAEGALMALKPVDKRTMHKGEEIWHGRVEKVD